MKPRPAALLLGVGAIASVALGLRPISTPAEGGAAAVPVVPLWSARRLPEALADAVGAAKLPIRLHETLDAADACFVMREGASLTFSLEPHQPLIPASTQKLLTAAAALSVLGADHRFETKVVAENIAGGTAPRLYLVGGADPLLMVAGYKASLDEDPLTKGHPVTSLEGLADAVVAAGVRNVAAGVVGDASRHQGARTVPTWRDTYISDHDVPFLSALTANGGWSQWEPSKVTAADPPAYAASELARLLGERGVTVDPAGSSGTAPGGAEVIAKVTSPPLADIVEAMIRESDNFIAEILVREVGLATSGQGTTEAGTAAVVDALAERGIDVEGVDLVDGSGLDRGNRATCGAVLGALDLRTDDKFRAIDQGLAVAGQTGTLHRRFKDTPLDGRLRAKTGSLKDVVGLVGTLQDRAEGRPDLTFALLANGQAVATGALAIQEAIATTLDAYPFPSADPDVLGPPPARSLHTPADPPAR